MRLIDADAIEADLKQQFKAVFGEVRKKVKPEDFFISRDWAYRANVTELGLECLYGYIKSRPTIEAEPVMHGCWVGTADGYADGELVYDMWECSECGYDADGADEKPNWNYCPNCGAKMDGGADHA